MVLVKAKPRLLVQYEKKIDSVYNLATFGSKYTRELESKSKIKNDNEYFWNEEQAEEVLELLDEEADSGKKKPAKKGRTVIVISSSESSDISNVSFDDSGDSVDYSNSMESDLDLF